MEGGGRYGFAAPLPNAHTRLAGPLFLHPLQYNERPNVGYVRDDAMTTPTLPNPGSSTCSMSGPMGSSTYRLGLCLRIRGGDGSTTVGAPVTPTTPKTPVAAMRCARRPTLSPLLMEGVRKLRSLFLTPRPPARSHGLPLASQHV